MNEQIDEYGFELVDVDLARLSREYVVRWKPLPVTDGPTLYLGGQYIWIAVSFAATNGLTRPTGHLDYALHRDHWQEQDPYKVTDADYDQLRELVRERLPGDLRAVDEGEQPEALRDDMNSDGLPLFL